MSAPIELWKKWEGKSVDEKFPLRRWLGASDQSAVFLTERSDGKSQKAVIKLIPAENMDAEAQLHRWTEAAKLLHPHLIRVFECGRTQIDGKPFLYAVMEYAEENLAEVLPQRALTPSEVSEMLPPIVAALTALHQSGFVHSRLKPSNIMAVGNHLKLSADGVGKLGERGAARLNDTFVAPEVSAKGLSPAADVWSLGITLIAVLTRNEPRRTPGVREEVAVAETIPQPFRRIAQRCLQIDPQQRPSLRDILTQLEVRAAAPAPVPVKPVAPHPTKEPPRRWILLPIVVVALCLVVWLGSRLIRHSAGPSAQTQTPGDQSQASSPAMQPPPFARSGKSPLKNGPRGRVLQQVMPEVSRSAQNTIRGRFNVGVQVSVDANGNVTQARVVNSGPSKYFAGKSLAAGWNWKFAPPQVGGHGVASEWTLRFQFARNAIQVFPTQTEP